MFIGTYFLPDANQAFLKQFTQWMLPILEVGVLAFIVIKVRNRINKVKTLEHTSSDFFTQLITACREIIPRKFVMPLATEVAVFYYGLFKWKSRSTLNNEFTNHKRSGTPALLWGLVLIIAVETFVIHLLLMRWNATAAWILSGLSIYAGIQVIGFAQSLAHRPILITKDALVLRYGILNEVEIKLNDVVCVELSRANLTKDQGVKKLSPLGELERHNVLIQCSKDYTLIGLWGIRKTFKTIALHVDKPEIFRIAIIDARASI
ncbi:MAG: hypothetical protein ACI9NN_001511 [Bacteroidia bacterium]